MPRTLMHAALCVALIAMQSGLARAQSMSTDEDRTVRPGDRIEWSGPAPHRVRFGGTVGSPPAPLTPLSDIERVLSFSPPLTVSGTTGSSDVGGTPMLAATVRDDAAASGVTAFNFTCGRHPADMLSLPFKIASKDGQPPRILKIKAVGLDWMLEKAGGDLKVDQR